MISIQEVRDHFVFIERQGLEWSSLRAAMALLDMALPPRRGAGDRV
ncbi:hypothetical protein [Actinomadura welshii]|nr:hypothetical protein [Actinomadura madurae]